MINTTQNTTTITSRCFVHDSSTAKTLRLVCYAILILMSLLGNAFVVAVVYRHKRLQTNVNCLISNMAVADLIITVVYMPRMLVMYELGAAWIGGIPGLALCKIVPFLHGVSLLVSILTLLLISLERFCAIIFPLKFIFTSKKTKLAIATAWCVSVAARIPYCLALGTVTSSKIGRIFCSSKLKNFFGTHEARDIYYTMLLGVFYALPLVVIVVSYAVILIYLGSRNVPGSAEHSAKQLEARRTKAMRNVLRMMVVVSVAFIACWITYFITR